MLIKRVNWSFIIVVFMLSLISNFALALRSDNDKPIQMQSNYAKYNRKTRMGTYRKNVKLDQGSTHITGDLAYTYLDKNNQLVKAVVHGKRAHYWTLPEPDKPELHARALTIIYYPQEHRVELHEEAEVVQGKDSFRGEVIKYNMLAHHVVSEQPHGGRSIINITPSEIG